MDIHDRLRTLRTHLNMTTRAFGHSIGLSGGVISNMENRRRNVTDRTVKDICREYNVNPDWLNSGIDPMFNDIFDGLELTNDAKELAEQYAMLSETDKVLVKNLLQSLAEKETDKPHESE